MLLSESLAWGLEHYNVSGVKVFCEESKRETILEKFSNDFKKLWDEALEKVKEEFGSCEEMEFPVKIHKKDYGFFISITTLEVKYCYGNYYDVTHSIKAFEIALKNIKTTFPEIEYEGYITFPVSDLRCGDVLQWELSYKRNAEIYDFVGETLNEIFAEEIDIETSDFWEPFFNELECNEDFEETIKILYKYSPFISKNNFNRAINAIFDIAEEVDEDIKEELITLVEELESH